MSDKETLFKVRKELRVSQKLFGELMGGYSGQAVCGWENGKKIHPTVMRIVNAIAADPDVAARLFPELNIKPIRKEKESD